jgi:hypothetical protein
MDDVRTRLNLVAGDCVVIAVVKHKQSLGRTANSQPNSFGHVDTLYLLQPLEGSRASVWRRLCVYNGTSPQAPTLP